MPKRLKWNRDITQRLTLLELLISNYGMQSMFDINRTMETVLVPLLNDLYDLSLKNLNEEQPNHPAIDLGDIAKGVAYQVTSDGSRNKKIKTLEKFEKFKLGETYSEIVFLVISKHQNVKLTAKGALPYSNYNIKYLKIGDIIKSICEITDLDKFSKIYKYCMEQIEFYPQDDEQRIYLSQDPVPTESAISLDDFFIANGIEFNENGLDREGKSRSEYFEEINTLLKVLSSLSDDERTLIYLIISCSIKYHNDNNKRFVDYCFAPLSYFKTHFPSVKDTQKIINAIESLEFNNLLYNNNEGDSRFEKPHIAITYTAQDEDLNYFTMICQFFREEDRQNLLKDTIVNCNFLNIT